ncbi:tetratricopeptide repeat protein [Selenomonadales bacterium OttesenSCG-928-I06]|nr:tetratricopeptide repeat protein [Selenomonadales bacterium OttesenSCG-928-I06]
MKKILILILVLIFSLNFSVCAEELSNDEYKKLGDECLWQRDYRKAVEYYDQLETAYIARLSKGDKTNIADAYVGLGDEIFDPNPEKYTNLIEAKQKYKEAIKYYETAVEIASSAVATVKIAEVKTAEQKLDEKKQILQEQENKIKIEEIKRTLHFYPNYISTANSFLMQKSYALAAENYKKTTDADELYPLPFLSDDKYKANIYYRLGLCNLYLKMYSEAIDNFNKALKLNEYLTEAYFHRGVAYEKSYNKKAAKDDFDLAEALVISNQ